MRTSVTRSFHFEAAHQLPWHEGKCRNLHGHSYRLDVTVSGPGGDRGIVVDFAEIQAVVQRDVLGRFCHTYLNGLLDQPPAELLAAEIWEAIEADRLYVGCVCL